MRRLRLGFPFDECMSELGGLGASLWDEINESIAWQDGIFYTLCGLYALVSAVALVCIWLFLYFNDNSVMKFIGRLFIACVSFVAALGFLVYGGRLFLMLRCFPIESKGRTKKLYEVGSVTANCFTCFLVKCLVVFLSAFDSDASLIIVYHPILNFIYYLLVEILPSAIVLHILRKLPPRRISTQDQPIR